MPVCDEVGVPDLSAAADPLDRTRRFAEAMVGRCESATEDPLAKREDGLGVERLGPERHLQHTVWDRGERFALLSATILSREAFCRGVGLDLSRVAPVDVDHTFPVGNRPLYDVTRGPMTYEERDETVPRIARLPCRLLSRHPDEKGIVHAHSYDIAARLADGPTTASRHACGLTAATTGTPRWRTCSDPTVPTSSPREDGGGARPVRARSALPDWFAARVDRMSTPDLPPLDADADEHPLSDVCGAADWDYIVVSSQRPDLGPHLLMFWTFWLSHNRLKPE